MPEAADPAPEGAVPGPEGVVPGPEVVVVGAGAAGLWVAARAAEAGRRVLVLEKTPRTGTKVLASGGTRCNLTTTLGPDDAGRLFGRGGERFLRRALRALPPRAVRERFAELGVPTVEAPLEKVFPASDRARDVRDALERWARDAGAEIRCNAGVRALETAGAGWRLWLEDGSHLDTPSVVLAAGGSSYPRSGTTGDGYRWLADLDLPLVEPVPALVPLTSPAPWVHALAGISVQEGEARLVDRDGRAVGRRRRPVVFTHTGVSGPGAMDLSAPVARGEGGHVLVLDLLPDVERGEIRARLIEGAGAPGAPTLHTVLSRAELVVPRRLLAAVCRQAGLGDENPRANALSKAARHDLTEALRGLEVPVGGTLGFDKAEVTAGGLELGCVDPGSMRVRQRPGLQVIGELLDLDGPIGGLNFQAAFACAEVAARALA